MLMLVLCNYKLDITREGINAVFVLLNPEA